MTNIEEKLWDYIDGTCSEEERILIAALIEKDILWGTTYNEILAINSEVAAITLDEPPMAFTYNVMEGIRAHEASKPLKTLVSKYVVGTIVGFLVLTVLIIITAVFAGAGQNPGSSVPALNLPALSILTNSRVMKAFFYFDVMLLLFLADALIRRKRNNTLAKSV